MPELPIFNLHPKDFQGSAAPSTAAATNIMYSLLLHLLAADLLFTQGPIQESLSQEQHYGFHVKLSSFVTITTMR